MPANESLHDYYLAQHLKIERCLDLCLVYAEAELVHELRLSIKKLKAFHKLAEPLWQNMGSRIRIKRKVRKLFRVAGELRDAQVQLQLLAAHEQKTNKEYPEFTKWLLKREKKRVLKFGKNPESVLPEASQITHQEIGDGLSLTSDAVILEVATNVLNSLCETARKLAAVNLNDRNLHRIRIISKQMRYILQIVQHCFPDFTFHEISVDSLRNIEAAAGNWHDNLVRIELLGKCMGKLHFTNSNENEKYQKLFSEFKSELDDIYFEACRVVRQELLNEEQR